MKLINEINTVSHPCSIESVRFDLKNNASFACGYYELNEEDQSRAGSCILYNNVCNEIPNGKYSFDSGILDMKWNHHNILGCALANSTLTLLEANDNNNDDRNANIFNELVSISDDTQGMFLSIDWNKYVNNQLCVTTQSSTAIIYTLNTSGSTSNNSNNSSSSLTEVYRIEDGHDIGGENVPMWVCCWSGYNSNILVTGGDDCKLKLYDIRCKYIPITTTTTTYAANNDDDNDEYNDSSCHYKLGVGRHNEGVTSLLWPSDWYSNNNHSNSNSSSSNSSSSNSSNNSSSSSRRSSSSSSSSR